jgi:hypothetical protein
MRKCHASCAVSGERTRLACWFRRRAETIFVSSVAFAARGESSNKVREPETASPETRETSALPNRGRRIRGGLFL